MKTQTPSTPRTWLRHPALPWAGTLLGGFVGVVDSIYFSTFDVAFTIAGRSVNGGILVGFTATLALCGYMLGRLALARAQAQEDRRTIAEQHDALETSQEALVQQEKLAALGRLVASIAHELRNPLGVIRSAADLLDESTRGGGAEPQQLQRAAELVTEEVDHMNATITSLLAFARPAQLTLSEVQLPALVQRAVELHSRSENPARQLDPTLQDATPAVAGDTQLLTQVMVGLLLNAAEAAGRDGQVQIRAQRHGQTVQVDVADDGPGIDPQDSQRIFEPFFTTKARGTGLGLALAHRIVHAHGGHLEAVQDAGLGPDGRGACLRLHLPVFAGSPA